MGREPRRRSGRLITIEQEREKYRRMWTEVRGYRSTSPGEKLVPLFLALSSAKPGDTVLDAGCGPGRAALKLQEAGLNAYMLDITPEAPDREARILPFIQACLWSRAVWPDYDWVYCCDVLEHIPPEHVSATLDNLRDMTKKGAFLQIALFADGWGNKIGETLHLSVHDQDWWKERIERRWQAPDYRASGDGRLIAMTGGIK